MFLSHGDEPGDVPGTGRRHALLVVNIIQAAPRRYWPFAPNGSLGRLHARACGGRYLVRGLSPYIFEKGYQNAWQEPVERVE